MRSTIFTTKKIPALALAMVLAGSTFICSCSKEVQESEPSISETSETSAVTETTAATTSEITESTSEPTANDWHNVVDYEQIELDGVKENEFTSTDYCYIESEKYVLFLDKDICLPGDFTDNVDAIIDEIEKQTGLSACPDGADYGPVIDQSIYMDGFNPWKDCYIGNKIPIFLFVDHEPQGWISCADFSGTTFVMYELYSDDAWYSIFPTGEDDWRRNDYIDYATVAHELTHTITLRHSNLTNILAEGIAEHMGRSVIEALADDHQSIGEFYEKRFLYDYSIPEAINADNAERIFTEDYNEISYADRGAEYTCGMYLCSFLHGRYGDGFFAMCSETIARKDLPYVYGDYDADALQKYTSAVKECFGEDIFTEFGNWCVDNGVLQEAG